MNISELNKEKQKTKNASKYQKLNKKPCKFFLILKNRNNLEIFCNIISLMVTIVNNNH
jgi:hypothetical protein